ncbi:recombinase family protein [Hydrogenophaga sp.]|uniref:recombinase family protein n=1 Tax=Hydrogenophaga sp. TaxID=1904254 RepID=UPI003918AED0
MTIYGYARTSTVEQVAGLEDQLTKLKAAGCTDQTIYKEQASAVKMEDRKAFAEVMTKLKAGDVLVVSTLSRIARSMIHMMEIEAKIRAAGASIRILDLAVDTATPNGRFTFNLFASIAQFERENMLERQKVGIAAAKEEGVYKGRKPTAKAKADKVLAYAAKGLTKQEIATALEIGVASVYRILAEAKQATA